MSGQRAIDCPICGREIGTTKPHHLGDKWDPQQKWLVNKLHRNGISAKVIAAVFDTSDGAVQELVNRNRREMRR